MVDGGQDKEQSMPEERKPMSTHNAGEPRKPGPKPKAIN